MKPYVILEKAVGETPLSCAEAYRLTHPELDGVPMAYAGRLDPMASGKLLILLGDECKKQTDYHGLDKEYEFSILFGLASDTHDVLGRLTNFSVKSEVGKAFLESDESEKIKMLQTVADSMTGPISLPYPLFSAKTVHGKPLHMWTLEQRLDEITIPTNESTVYSLIVERIETVSRAEMVTEVLKKIETIPPVTELRKALGNDFRRVDVRNDWNNVLQDETQPQYYSIAYFRCVSASGTYMRSLAHVIGEKIGLGGLAWHIHRTIIGTFNPTTRMWDKVFE